MMAYWGSVILCVVGVYYVFDIEARVDEKSPWQIVVWRIAVPVLIFLSAVVWKHVFS